MVEVVQLKRLSGSSSAVGGRDCLIVSDEVLFGSCCDDIEGVDFDSSRPSSTMSLAAGSYDDTVASE